MDAKLSYISRHFSRAEKKRFEHYVVTRIFHRLDDLEIKFVTQQYVVRPSGRALTDMYFPQLQLHIEVDEGFHKMQIEADTIREADIVNATGHEVLRVDTTKCLNDINCNIEEIIARIKERKARSTNFSPWDIDKETNPQTYIDKGSIDLGDDCAFPTMVAAANCFGKILKKNAIWTGGVKHPIEPNTLIWFPKLYLNSGWHNSISEDESTIFEKTKATDKVAEHVTAVFKSMQYRRVVFARVKSPLGDVMYRFKGVYALDEKSSNETDGVIWRRVSTSAKTYKPSNKEVVELV